MALPPSSDDDQEQSAPAAPRVNIFSLSIGQYVASADNGQSFSPNTSIDGSAAAGAALTGYEVNKLRPAPKPAQFDFSKLPLGKTGSREALAKLLGRENGPFKPISDQELANAGAFLDMIACSEGTAQIGFRHDGGKGYNVLVGGGIVDDLSHHPNKPVYIANLGISSSAFGRYQFLGSTWEGCRTALNLPNMQADAQDYAALYLIKQAGGLEDVVAGRFDAATAKVRRIWASIPGANYGQHEQTRDFLAQAYIKAGGKFENDPTLTSSQKLAINTNDASPPGNGNGRSQYKVMGPHLPDGDAIVDTNHKKSAPGPTLATNTSKNFRPQG